MAYTDNACAWSLLQENGIIIKQFFLDQDNNELDQYDVITKHYFDRKKINIEITKVRKNICL